MEELFRLMETWPDVALERVQRAEKWTSGWTVRSDGSRCLIGHAVDASNVQCYVAFTELVGLQRHESRLVYDLFDPWAGAVGADVAGRECSARAAEILAARRALKAEEVACIG